MNKVGVGLIGAGKAGALFGRAINASSNGRLVALAAATKEEAETVLACERRHGHNVASLADGD